MARWRFAARTSVVALGLTLAACDGGSSPTPTPTPTPANAAPVFTSPASLTVPENTNIAQTITATDANGDAISYALTGGADRDFFALTADGHLAWASAGRFLTGQANYDTFEDADHDSVYQVQITATDARGATAVQSLAVTLQNDRENIAVHRVATGFSHPVALAAIPGGTMTYVAEKTGKIYQLDTANGQKTLALTISDISTDGERGILAMELGPVRATGEYLFVMYTDALGDIVVRRYARALLGGTGPIASYQVVSIPRRAHNDGLGGWVTFLNNDLYIGTPDGGGVDDPLNTAQDPNSLLGKVLRLTRNPDTASATLYVGAPSNPYAAGGGSPLVTAMGLHNPNGGASLTIGTSVIFSADRGTGRGDEIDDVWGDYNLGWPYVEGSVSVRPNPPANLTAPLAEFGRGTGWKKGQGLVGGVFFSAGFPGFGSYFFADLGGDFWSDIHCGFTAFLLPTLSCGLERRTADFVPDAGEINRPVDLAPGPQDADIFFIVDDDGDIFRVNHR